MEQLDREPTAAELAKALGIEVSELASYQTMAQPRHLLSFDEMPENAQGEESLPLGERLPDPHAAEPDAALIFAEDRRLMFACVAALPQALNTVIVLHYIQKVPLRDVAKLLKVTPSRVSQLHQQGLTRLKQGWSRAQTLA